MKKTNYMETLRELQLAAIQKVVWPKGKQGKRVILYWDDVKKIKDKVEIEYQKSKK